MIVQMKKAMVVARRGDQERLLQALGRLGVMHLAPVDPSRAVPAEETAASIDHLGRAVQMLGDIEPAGPRPDLSPIEATEEVLRIHSESGERRARLATLHRQVEHLEAWGDVTLDQFTALAEAGIEPKFFSLSAEDVSTVEADVAQIIRELPRDKVLLATITRGREPSVPESAEPIELPSRDRPSLRTEAQQIDEALRNDARELAALAHLTDEMRAEEQHLTQQAGFTVAQRSGLADENLFAVQGWIPADHAETLATDLATADVDAAVQLLTPEPNEQPPTLIRYPRWAKPIKALFGILGTVPGYREYDLAPFFMLAMPIFTAMLVGDAGYGLLFVIIGGALYKRMVHSGNRAAGQMILVFAAATLIWGAMTGNYFGVSPAQMMDAGGVWGALGSILQPLALLWRSDPEAARNIVMKISFIIGAVHLSMAHLRQAAGLLPDPRGIAELTWVGFIFGMFSLVWMMFFPDEMLIPPTATLWTLVGSWAGIVLFSSPHRNPIKRIGFGVLGNLMTIPGAFGDMLSYIRLMAVGLASYYIASAFNGLAADLGGASPWVIPAAVLVVLFAHALNVGLCLVAIFAHGVRLNMLEFSTNAGVQWDGYAYAPFAQQDTLEGER